MKIAIPLQDGRVFPECGEPGEFAVVDIDETTRTTRETVALPPPSPSSDALSDWLLRQGVEVVLTRGIRPDQQAHLTAKGIRVVVGVPPFRLEAVVANFLNDTLESGPNICESGA